MTIDLTKYDFSQYKRVFINGGSNIVMVDHNGETNTIKVGDRMAVGNVFDTVKKNIAEAKKQ